MKVALSAKNLEREVNYINPHKVISGHDETVFTLTKLEEEVKSLTKKQKRNYKRICSQVITTATTFFTLINPAMAATTGVPSIMPQDILEIGMWIIGILATASFVLAMILLQVAGGYKMIFRKKKSEANAWSIEIIRGFSQIMLAPALVISIALVMYLLFGSSQWFVSPLGNN